MLARLPGSRQVTAGHGHLRPAGQARSSARPARRTSPGTCAVVLPGGSVPGEDRDPVAVLRGHRQRCGHRVDARRLGLRPGAPADRGVLVDRRGRQRVRGHHLGPDQETGQAATVPAAGAAPCEGRAPRPRPSWGGSGERPAHPACTPSAVKAAPSPPTTVRNTASVSLAPIADFARSVDGDVAAFGWRRKSGCERRWSGSLAGIAGSECVFACAGTIPRGRVARRHGRGRRVRGDTPAGHQNRHLLTPRLSRARRPPQPGSG